MLNLGRATLADARKSGSKGVKGVKTHNSDIMEMKVKIRSVRVASGGHIGSFRF